MNANAGLFGFGGDSWKEEVLLHDGQKIIVQRTQSYGGRHEIGQSSPVKEHRIEFTLPGTNKRVTWTSEYGEDLGRTNFNLLGVHVLDGVPYLVVEPNLSLSYNKWGRPNPPYVLFKHEINAWRRIAMDALPPDFKTLNVLINHSRMNEINGAASKTGYVSAEDVKKINSSLQQPEYRTIVREPLDHWKPRQSSNSGEKVRTREGGWIGIGWFRDQPSFEACLKYCEREKVSPQDCPCNTLFKGK